VQCPGELSHLSYWLTNRDKYPILSLIIRKYLQIPVISAPSERYFSQGALIINKLRNRINKYTFLYIIALKSWGLYREENKEERIIVQPEKNLFIINPIN
jgi:hAT family C-terminal dimerisation region